MSKSKKYFKGIIFIKSKLIAFTIATVFASQSFAQNATMQQKPNDQNPKKTPSGYNVYYANCTDARSKGAATIYRGEPGYRSALDRDNEDMACEPYKGQK